MKEVEVDEVGFMLISLEVLSSEQDVGLSTEGDHR